MASHQTALPETDGWTLHKIKKQLWCCINRYITIYDVDLVILSHIEQDMGWISSLADLGDNVAAASSDGLFVLTNMGRINCNIFIKYFENMEDVAC